MVGNTRPPFDDSTRQWIRRHVSSSEQLDLLILLDRDRTRFWSVDNAAAALRLSRPAVRAAAEALAARNFLEVRCGADVLYRLDPGNSDLVSLVERVVDAGRRNRAEAVRALGLRRSSAPLTDRDTGTKGSNDVAGNGSHA